VIVALYLTAIVAANLSVAWFGPGITVVNAFVFIGLDLTARDRLHDAWSGNYLLARMAVLIAVGGAISYLLNREAAQIALASTVSFIAAAGLDGLVYAMLGERKRLLRVNGSNIVSAAADSVLFPTIAFGSFLPAIVLGQFVAKVLGGFVWSIILNAPDLHLRRRSA